MTLSKKWTLYLYVTFYCHHLPQNDNSTSMQSTLRGGHIMQSYSKQGINPSLQYYWWFRNPTKPNNHLGWWKNTRKYLVNKGRNYQPQLGQDFWTINSSTTLKTWKENTAMLAVAMSLFFRSRLSNYHPFSWVEVTNIWFTGNFPRPNSPSWIYF